MRYSLNRGCCYDALNDQSNLDLVTLYNLLFPTQELGYIPGEIYIVTS